MVFAVLAVVVILLGLLPAWIAHRKAESFWLWWLLGTAAFGIMLPLAVVVPRPGERDPLESRRFTLLLMAGIIAVNSIVIVGGWEMAGY